MGIILITDNGTPFTDQQGRTYPSVYLNLDRPQHNRATGTASCMLNFYMAKNGQALQLQRLHNWLALPMPAGEFSYSACYTRLKARLQQEFPGWFTIIDN